MGTHRKEPGLSVITALEAAARVLGYHPRREESMFPGEPSSPELDLTWRRMEHAKFPLFIFEVESAASKAAADNAVKVFARKTPAFEKPLFFFHLFVEDDIGSERVTYLTENFDKLNYGTYRLYLESDNLRLVKDIIAQHLRLNPFFDLYSFMALLQHHDVLRVSASDVLDVLLAADYDHAEGADFLLTVEMLIVNGDTSLVKDYYLRYLTRYLADSARKPQNYSYAVSRNYSTVIHYAIAQLCGPAADREDAYQELRNIEDTFEPWKLWEPFFGLSRDHDHVLLSEFPLILSFLCAAFAPASHAGYFSQKLARILREIRNFTHFNIHGLVWLLIASRISCDRESYEFARSTINDNGGIPLDLVRLPTVFVGDEQDPRLRNPSNVVSIPDFSEWSDWLKPQLSDPRGDLLASVLDGFLIVNDAEGSRSRFAAYCLQRSVGCSQCISNG
jgi:hypothetical protein